MNKKARNGPSPLTRAVLSGCLGLVQRLLDRGADVVPPGDGQYLSGDYSPLIVAARRGHRYIVQALLKTVADANSEPIFHMSGPALTEAQLFLDAGANMNLPCSNPDCTHVSALAAAVATHKAQFVQMLLDAGANANQQLHCGKHGSALAGAASSSYRKGTSMFSCSWTTAQMSTCH